MIFRGVIILTALIGSLQLCCYRLASASAALDGHFPSPQPDARLYCQAAKRVCQGHPFSYSHDEPPSTGTTSVLYPFVLAVPYDMGAHGDCLLEAGFWINGFCYLLFLLSWTLTFFRWICSVRGRVLAACLLALSGQPAICAFSQSDTGLWMMVSSLLVLAFAYERFGWVTFFSVLGPWVRPEGMYIVAAMGIVAICCPAWRRRLAIPFFAGLVSSISVFGLNYCLTGRLQFDSIGHKGFFKTQPFASACLGTARDAILIFRAYFVGLDENWPRMTFTIPIIGGVFIWLGVFTHRWKVHRDISLACLSIAALISLAVLSTSQQLGQNFERYLAWTTPLFILFTAIGVVRCTSFSWMHRCRKVLLLAVVFFYLFSGVVCVFCYLSASKDASSVDEYYRASEMTMAAEDKRLNRVSPGSVGGYSCAALYDYSDRQFRNLAGIYSPEFFDCGPLPLAFELLKHRPDLRFDYWQMFGVYAQGAIANVDDVLGPELLAGPDNLGLRRADWSAFDKGASSPKSLPGMTMMAAVDVGYVADERRCDYEIVDRWGREARSVFLAAAKLNGEMAVDSGRIITGGDSMTLELIPGRDCIVTVRTLSKKNGVSFNSPIRMLVQINNKDVGTVAYDVDEKSDDFQEFSFSISGKNICQNRCRVDFLGDHIACGYWFWQ